MHHKLLFSVYFTFTIIIRLFCFTAYGENHEISPSVNTQLEIGDNTYEPSCALGNRGRFCIPSLRFAVPLYDEYSRDMQTTVNLPNSAVLIESFGTTPAIADLCTQGFTIIKTAAAGDRCYIEDTNHRKTWYTFHSADYNGRNTGSSLITSSGSDVLHMGNEFLACYTSNEDHSISIIIWKADRNEPVPFTPIEKITSWAAEEPAHATLEYEPRAAVSQPECQPQWQPEPGNTSVDVYDADPADWSAAEEYQSIADDSEAPITSPEKAGSIMEKKQYGTGAYGTKGRLVIPEYDFAVPLYDEYGQNPQITVDNVDSAVLMDSLGSTPVIGDHYNQGFSVIKKVGEGTTCYIEDENHNKTWYEFSSADKYGKNMGTKLVNSNGDNVLESGENYMACYTCNNDPFSLGTVTIVIWENISGSDTLNEDG